MRNNKVVLLDEATANIDVITEQTIQQLINEELIQKALGHLSTMKNVTSNESLRPNFGLAPIEGQRIM